MPSAKTTSAIGHIGKGFADAIGTYVRLKMALNKEKERQDQQLFMGELAQGRMDLAQDRFGFEQTQAENRLKTDMMGGFNQQQEQPKPMTEMESLKVQEQKIKIAKMLRELEQGGQDKAIGKTSELIHAKTEAKAYSDYLKESPDEDTSFLTRMLAGEDFSGAPPSPIKLSPSAWKGSRELPKQWSPEPSAFDKRDKKTKSFGGATSMAEFMEWYNNTNDPRKEEFLKQAQMTFGVQ